MMPIDKDTSGMVPIGDVTSMKSKGDWLDREIYFITSGHSDLKTGGEVYNYRMMDYLACKGFKVHILEAKNLAPLIRRTHLIYNFYMIWRFRNVPVAILIENSYMHSRLFIFNLYIKLFKRAKLICICCHPYYLSIPNPLLRVIDKLIEGFFYKQFGKIIAISKDTKAQIESLGVPSQRIDIVPPAFDDHVMGIETARDYGPKIKPKILFTGNCDPRKGLEYLLEAVPLLGVDCHIILAGDDHYDPSYTARLRQMINLLDIGRSIQFLGRISKEELYRQYREADIFVLPSLWEGYGIVLMEAMSFGLPIVATNAGAAEELIRDQENGLLVPPKNSAALARALKKLIESFELRRKFGEAAREVFRSNSRTWEQAGKMFVESVKAR